jgi:hypothetical protein
MNVDRHRFVAFPFLGLPPMRHPALSLLIAVAAGLTGCEQLGIESPEKVAAARQAEGNAIGGACRHAGRAIEDCYSLNRKADKAAIFAGWRDMNDYMRENKIEPVSPQLGPTAAPKGTEGDSRDSVDAASGAARPSRAASAAREDRPPKEDKAG